MRITKERRASINAALRSINQPKHDLIEVMSTLEGIMPTLADKLGSIIGRLEDFQNRHTKGN